MDEDKERVAAICKAKRKTIDMRRVYADIAFNVLFLSALFVMLVKEYLKNNGGKETAAILEYVVIALMLGAVIIRIAERLLPKWFGHKPNRKEKEE